jgi:hypothetical protein
MNEPLTAFWGGMTQGFSQLNAGIFPLWADGQNKALLPLTYHFGMPVSEADAFPRIVGTMDGVVADTQDLYTLRGQAMYNPAKAIFVRGEGMTPGSTGMLQFRWWIEYVSNPWDTIVMTPSPVDPQFEALLGIVRNPKAMPYIVKGHSFFRRLREIAGTIAKYIPTAVKVGGIIAQAL